ncbi:uroporphyrinogen-III C-methyltransferase [Celerinatantimonas diazotrophica]|uniref:Uroporphyrin-3 C-methyltransferase n=1 Tax=Celerinatantimonas diazotrophica TaxID=412034 RepID=A0A4R1KGL7_9GAMM|nr:uroporphyrinogen-III C-methyltransferase [Celerinatantimonas diazotrophica]TCK63337.1 uroporphyrin-3 C-methyltransferase [Celerinatantimonas diazotrophica]CAG9298481.1 Protein HemX [Celerinatantimonas diazotrophica]
MSDQSSQPIVEQPESKPSKGPWVLAAVALIVSVAVGGYGWQQIHGMTQQVQQLSEQNAQLQSTLSSAQTTAAKQAAQLRAQLAQNQQDLKTQSSQSRIVLSQMQNTTQALKQQLANLNIHDLNQWRLYEAQYLVHLAARKAWLEGDITSAIALLKSADKGIAQLHDPKYIPLRRALADDINQLDSLPKVDIEGIMIQINSLREQIAHLSLTRVNLPKVSDAAVPSEQKPSWKTRLADSWHKFINQFVTVRRRDSDTKPLLAPEKAWYLKQNLQLQLQQAALAAGNHQSKLYKQSLTQASQWLSQYFTHNPAAEHLVNAIAQLQKQSVAAVKPGQLNSVELIDKAVDQISQQDSSKEEAK